MLPKAFGWRAQTLIVTLLCASSPPGFDSLPLQWEQIQPVGIGPTARYSHASVNFPTAEGMVFVFGGVTSEGSLSDQTWMYDSSAKAWELVSFVNGSVTACSDEHINRVLPEGRAAHSMSNVGESAIMCGGYRSRSSTSIVLATVGSGMECWWLTPFPQSRWDPVLLPDASGVPQARYGHTLAFDSDSGYVVLFGGINADNTYLNDVWAMQVNSSGTHKYSKEHKWTQILADPTASEPEPRYGHGMVYFRGSMYVLGGFSSNGLVVSAQDDMWRMLGYSSGTAVWEEVFAASERPGPRGFHAVWLSGFSALVHGGQGDGGIGVASVLEDTWQYDFFTNVWTRFGTSDAAPVVSHVSVTPLIDTQALSFGGKTKDSAASGKMYLFDEASGWLQVNAAGVRPRRRAGHTAVYDDGSQKMIVSLGMASSSELLNDIWIWDLNEQQWTCFAGNEDVCLHGPSKYPMAPQPTAYGTSASVGLGHFVFGGFSLMQKDCSSGVGKHFIPVASNAFWFLNLATYLWQRVDPESPLLPEGRAFAASATPDTIGDYKWPMLLFGGANMDCLSFSSPCVNPSPRDDLWIIDLAVQQDKDLNENDKMAEMDGVDDIISIQLPEWCDDASLFSVLWIEAWIQLSALGQIKVILFDAYSQSTPIFRWYLQGTETGDYVVLLFKPGKDEVLVKQWGPIDTQLLGAWHHLTFTIRAARKYSRTSSKPALVLTQAFMFLDAARIPSGDEFIKLDIDSQLTLESGLSQVYVGGPDPSVGAAAFSHFSGAIDNIRLWWPPCPHKRDPTMCNPYGFIHPRMEDGSILPAALRGDGTRVGEDDVTIEDVALPVFQYMFMNDVPVDGQQQGLLIHLNFNTDILQEGIIPEQSQWTGPERCDSAEQFFAHCSECPSTCVFGNCANFDPECVEAGASNVDALRHYATSGICQCLSIAECPVEIPECLCPTGLNRVCSGCLFKGICIAGSANGRICNKGSECPGGTCQAIDPMYCPYSQCSAWTCSCFNINATNSSASGVLGEVASVDSGGNGQCSSTCPSGQTKINMPLMVERIVASSLEQGEEEGGGEGEGEGAEGPGGYFGHGGPPPLIEYETVATYPCCSSSDLQGVICKNWSATEELCTVYIVPNEEQDCGIQFCCLDDSSADAGGEDYYYFEGPGGGGGPGGGDGPGGGFSDPGDYFGGDSECQISIDTPGTFIGTFNPHSRTSGVFLKALGGGAHSAQISDVTFVGRFVPSAMPETEWHRSKRNLHSQMHDHAPAIPGGRIAHSLSDQGGRHHPSGYHVRSGPPHGPPSQQTTTAAEEEGEGEEYYGETDEAAESTAQMHNGARTTTIANPATTTPGQLTTTPEPTSEEDAEEEEPLGTTEAPTITTGTTSSTRHDPTSSSATQTSTAVEHQQEQEETTTPFALDTTTAIGQGEEEAEESAEDTATLASISPTTSALIDAVFSSSTTMSITSTPSPVGLQTDPTTSSGTTEQQEEVDEPSSTPADVEQLATSTATEVEQEILDTTTAVPSPSPQGPPGNPPASPSTTTLEEQEEDERATTAAPPGPSQQPPGANTITTQPSTESEDYGYYGGENDAGETVAGGPSTTTPQQEDEGGEETNDQTTSSPPADPPPPPAVAITTTFAAQGGRDDADDAEDEDETDAPELVQPQTTTAAPNPPMQQPAPQDTSSEDYGDYQDDGGEHSASGTTAAAMPSPPLSSGTTSLAGSPNSDNEVPSPGSTHNVADGEEYYGDAETDDSNGNTGPPSPSQTPDSSGDSGPLDNDDTPAPAPAPDSGDYSPPDDSSEIPSPAPDDTGDYSPADSGGDTSPNPDDSDYVVRNTAPQGEGGDQPPDGGYQGGGDFGGDPYGGGGDYGGGYYGPTDEEIAEQATSKVEFSMTMNVAVEAIDDQKKTEIKDAVKLYVLQQLGYEPTEVAVEIRALGRRRHLLSGIEIIVTVVTEPTTSQSVAETLASESSSDIGSSNVLQAISAATGLPPPVFLQSPQTLGVICGDGDVGEGEECDEGVLNSDYGACTSSCGCNRGFAIDNITSVCVCNSQPGITVSVGESSKVQGASNTLTFTVQFASSVQGLASGNLTGQELMEPVIITIGNLTGSKTSDDVIAVTCSGPQNWNSVCELGLVPAADSDQWRKGVGVWNQDSGTLKFTVLGSINPSSSAVVNSDSVTLSFTLQNSDHAQHARQPYVMTCSSFAITQLTDANSAPILGSNEVTWTPEAELLMLTKSSASNTVVKVAEAKLLSGVSPEGSSSAKFSIVETVGTRDFTAQQWLRKPLLSNWAGELSSAIRVDFVDSSTKAANIDLSLSVSFDKISRQGGCYSVSDLNLFLCIPGNASMVMYDPAQQHWLPIATIAGNINSVSFQAQESATYAVVSGPPCNDFGGQGRAGGDRVCRVFASNQTDTRSTSISSLGEKTLSKMPAISVSTKPKYGDLAVFKQKLNESSSGSGPYKTRSNWTKIEPKNGAIIDWPTSRYGHAMAASGKRILIFGGITCAVAENTSLSQNGCNSLVMADDDLWELDVQVAIKMIESGSSSKLFRKLEVSPALGGLTGSMISKIRGENHRLLVFGGIQSTDALVLAMIRGDNIPEIDESLRIRELLFRAGKANGNSMDSIGALSGHSMVSNESHVILFGGFLRNSLSSGMYTYKVKSSTPSAGLSSVTALAEGPESRAFASMQRQSENEVLIVGGVKAGTGLADMWILNSNTRSWQLVFDKNDVNVPDPVVFNAVTLAEVNAETWLISHGGILLSYSTGETFNSGPTIPVYDHQPTTLGRIYRRLPSGASSWLWLQASSQNLNSGSGPPARAMHSAESGYFFGGRLTMMIYGGIGSSGSGLSDLWMLDLQDTSFAYLYTVKVSASNSTAFSAEGFVELAKTAFNTKSSNDPICSQAAVHMHQLQSKRSGSIIDISFQATEDFFEHCIELIYKDASAYSSAATTVSGLSGSTLFSAELDASPPELGILVADQQYDQTSSCKSLQSKCMRGICLSSTGGRQTDSAGTVEYCYSDSDPCTSGTYSCSLPGVKHGHRMTKLTLRGQSQILLMFGGESTSSLTATSGITLSADVHVGYFSSSIVTWTKLSAADANLTACTTSSCPVARREAAIAILGNEGSSNGKLLVFGGIAAITSCDDDPCDTSCPDLSTSPVLSYLKGTANDVYALNDLWYLDLGNLDLTCVKEGQCSVLPWVQIDVPGARPTSRWGASIVLDSADNLYITGGVTYSRCEGAYTELSDLYVFQLRDPFYKLCSATGGGLFDAIAGTEASFSIQCRDNFNQPATGARFRVEIAGPIEMSPSPYGTDVGIYACSYTPVIVGTYTVRIYVGRGGTEYQDLIGGVDSVPSNDIHEFSGGVALDKQTFTLTVKPGSTSAKGSSSTGSFLSLSTSGVVGSFAITAQDAFGNRRPGGDRITAVMQLWSSQRDALEDESLDPETATISDNRDGTYSATYSITRSGEYMLNLAFANTVGAGTPILLTVESGPSDVSKTYAYGKLREIKAGSPSLLFVQTRDKYGNYARVDPSIYPSGIEQIVFELCITFGGKQVVTSNEECGGGNGQKELNVGIITSYSVGPDGNQKDGDGEYYFGLYTINFFPYIADSYSPRVRHNGTYIECFFDTTGESVDSDPGYIAADSCIADVQAKASLSRRIAGPVLRVAGGDIGSASTRSSEHTHQPELLEVSRRASVMTAGFQTEVKTSFVPPENDLIKFWLFWAPVGAASIGIFFELVATCYRFARHRKRRKWLKNWTGLEVLKKMATFNLYGKHATKLAGISRASIELKKRAEVIKQRRSIEVTGAPAADPTLSKLHSTAEADNLQRMQSDREDLITDSSGVVDPLPSHRTSNPTAEDVGDSKSSTSSNLPGQLNQSPLPTPKSRTRTRSLEMAQSHRKSDDCAYTSSWEEEDPMKQADDRLRVQRLSGVGKRMSADETLLNQDRLQRKPSFSRRTTRPGSASAWEKESQQPELQGTVDPVENLPLSNALGGVGDEDTLTGPAASEASQADANSRNVIKAEVEAMPAATQEALGKVEEDHEAMPMTLTSAGSAALEQMISEAVELEGREQQEQAAHEANAQPAEEHEGSPRKDAALSLDNHSPMDPGSGLVETADPH